MKALNLGLLVYGANIDDFSLYENRLACRQEYTRIKEQDVDALKGLLDALSRGNHVLMKDLSDFYFSFSIDHISKEFDLLKIAADKSMILNIELKGREVPEEQIKKQLIQNRYYLRHITDKILSYTYVADGNMVYKLDDEDVLHVASLSEINTVIHHFPEALVSDIEDLFDPISYLVSPVSNPAQFMRHEYFLNGDQSRIKNEILRLLQNHTAGSPFIGIEGAPGSGKSLLLYDIAVDVSCTSKVLIIHCAWLSEIHKTLCLPNVDIISIRDFDSEYDFSPYGTVFVDEAQRLHESDYHHICKKIRQCSSMCVFSFDSGQILEKDEIRGNISRKIKESTKYVFPLSKSFRINKELSAFIHGLFDTRKWSHKYKYQNVDVLYADNRNIANKIKRLYQSKGYQFINFTLSPDAKTSFEYYDGGESTHRIIGQEYPDVVVIINDHFFYSEEGVLQADAHPNPNYLYLNMLYQNLTRAIRNLCVIVVDNQDLFNKIQQMLRLSYPV